MTTDIARRSDFPIDVDQQLRVAKALADAGVLPDHLRRQPANILAIGMAARALDVPTWTALQQVVPIDGKVAIQADLMRALVLRAGHRFRVERADTTSATVVVIRADDPDYEHRVTVTLAELPEELTRKKTWRNYTADMLVARATSKVCRRACSDVLNGMSYTPDELGADTDDDGRPVRATAPTRSAQRPPQPDERTCAADIIIDADVVAEDPPPGYDGTYDDNLPGSPDQVDAVIAEAEHAGAGLAILEHDVAGRYDGRTIHQLTRGELRAEWLRWHQDTADHAEEPTE